MYRIVFKFIIGFLVFSIAWVLIYKFVPIPFTFTMISNSVQNWNSDGPIIWSKKWKPLDKISKNYMNAVIASEDQKFEDHHGFDFEAIQEAFKKNEKNPKKLRGGSTLSQQTAKNAFLWQGRSWLRKGLEAYFTVLIEIIWGKDRIMEVYLNIAEMGDGVYGVEAASEKYFNKPAKNVSREEAALIAAILPSPKRYSASNPGPYIKRRQRWILRQMRYVNWK